MRGVASRPTHWPTCRYIGDSFMLAFNVRVFSPFLRLNFPGPTRVYDAVAEKPTAALRDGAVVRIPCTRTLVVAITRAHPDHLFFFSFFFFFLNSKVTKYSDVSTFQDFNGRGRVFLFWEFLGNDLSHQAPSCDSDYESPFVASIEIDSTISEDETREWVESELVRGTPVTRNVSESDSISLKQCHALKGVKKTRLDRTAYRNMFRLGQFR